MAASLSRSRLSAGLLALVALGLSACGGGSSTSAPKETPTTLAGAGAGGDDGAGGAAVTAVTISTSGSSWAFGPKTVKVATGTELTWTNNTSVPHTVTFNDKAVPSSELFNEHETYKTTLAAAGRFTYFCTIHPDMKGTVVVT